MKRERTPYDATLEARSYEYALRDALRKCGIYLKIRTEPQVIGLRIPADTDLVAYREALRTMLHQTEAVSHYHVATVALGRRGDTLQEDAQAAVKMRTAVIVIIESGTTIHPEFVLAFDRIVAVDPVKPVHLMSAAKNAWEMIITRDEAAELAKFPSALLFSALRKGRPISTVLAKLRSGARSAKTLNWQPRLEELSGYGDAKAWGQTLVSDMKDWRSGKIAWSDVDCGLLLSGPPGTGKTLFASALARSCSAHFIAASCAEWQSEGHLGDMLGAMRKTFRQAQDGAPTILLIDEIDAIGDRRSFGKDHADYSRQVVNALLELLDGSNPREGVVVIGASNFPDNIDPALRRPGRLDRHVAIGLPDTQARAHMLASHLGTGSITSDALMAVAKSMSGYSGALIAQVARDARRIARKRGRVVELEDVLALVPPLAVIQHDERWETCLHEAGHVIVGLEVSYGDLEFVAVAREVGHHDRRAGYVHWKPKLRLSRSRQSYLDEIAMIIGGMAAEKIIIGDVLDGSGGTEGSDLHRASDIATLMTASLGLSSLYYSDVSTRKQLEDLRREDPVVRERVEDTLSEQLDRAKEVIAARRKDVEVLARLLMERELIPGEEVLALVGSKPGDQTAA
ncbi:AAA family ATPase [Rhizobium sp.]|uniref:AAA family ATPase n=1 Tax=Rhizobium sp. TaxID=391 RepID=UPI0028ACB581